MKISAEDKVKFKEWQRSSRRLRKFLTSDVRQIRYSSYGINMIEPESSQLPPKWRKVFVSSPPRIRIDFLKVRSSNCVSVFQWSRW